MESKLNDLKGKRRRVSDYHNTLDENNKLDSQDKNYWSPSPPSSSDESMGFNNDSNDSETDSDSENDVKYHALKNNISKPKANWHDMVFSESEADSCSSSTITDDSYSTVTGENNHNARVFDDWQTWIPELSSSEDDTPLSNIKKRQRIGNHSMTCFVCGGPELYFNFICICVGCNVGYHQMCHKPQISDSIAKKLSSISEKWLCTNCQKKANSESSILYGNHPINNIRVDTNSTLNHDKVNENTIDSVNRQALGRDEEITNIDVSSKNRKPDFYQEKSNKCLLTVKKEIKGSSDNNDCSSRFHATSDQNHKSKALHKKRRGILPVIIQPFERRHSTASELRKLFEKCPLSIVNFDEIFIPEEWGNFVEIPTTSVEYIMPSSSISPGTNAISFKQSKYVDTSASIDYGLPGKISTLTGKNVVSIRKHASLSPNKNSATPALKRVHLPSKNVHTPTNKRVVTSSNNNGSHTKSITPSIKGTDSRSRKAIASRDKSYSTPGKNTLKNGRGSSSDDDYSPTKKVISQSKPVGLVDTDNADFNIMSLLPPNLIPCLNFGELAFREGTIDRKKTIKRGRVFPVIK